MVSTVTNAITAMAADTYTDISNDIKNGVFTIQNADDFKKLLNADPAVYQKITVLFSNNQSQFKSSDFTGIEKGLGNEEYPFMGTVKANEGSAINLPINFALFEYLSDSANLDTIIFARPEEKNSALLAENVIHGDVASANKWKIKADPVDDSGATNYKSFTSVIGNMKNGANVDLDITLSNGVKAEVSGGDNAGLACGSMDENTSLAVSLSSNLLDVSGKSNAGVFVGKMSAGQAFVKRMDIQERLRRSVEENYKGFELYYQPIVNTRKKKILGAEALLRWQDDVVGRLSPAEFVPLLEESGLIIPVGRWVIRTALEQCLCWQKKDKNFRMNINLSSIQLKKSDVIMDIETIMQELGIGNHNVLFEVTESGELESDSITQKILFSFRKRNLNLGIDDFGTGYSNFRYVKEMMFDLVKIDQAFIRNITKSQYDYLVVKQMTELAHSLNLKVCYEGVETADDLECVLDLNPDYIQGYYFAKPTTASDFETRYLCMEQKF